MADIKAPMGGKIIKLLVKEGDLVSEDDEVAILEAMKMEMPVIAEENGTVVKLKVVPGETVEAEQTIITLG